MIRGRRSFIKRFMLGMTGLIGLTILDAFWFEKYIIRWTEFDLSENSNERISVIQLSDIHLQKINFSLKNIGAVP